jgi:hypothetical protein
MAAERKRFLLRLDPRLYDVLRRWADDELRSVNAQIERLLVEEARRAGRWKTADDHDVSRRPERGG